MKRRDLSIVCSSQAAERDTSEVEVQALHPDAGAFGSIATLTWRKAWRVIWIQSILSFLSAILLSVSYVIQWNMSLRTMVSKSQLLLGICSSGLGFSLLSFILLLSHMLWTWGYTRAAVKLNFLSESMERSLSREEEERGIALFDLCRNLRQSLEIGTGMGLVGILISSVGMMKIVGSVAFYMIRQRGFNLLFWANNPPVMLQARDVFLGNCNVVMLVAHTLGLLFVHSLKRKLP
uniref:Uncharacterized protein n=1 Tax=Hanusia phi TaxID=3032 RepID=A0A7S0DYM3_9CRYP